MSARPGGLRDGVRLAVGTLTMIPVPPPVTVDRDAARAAMLLGPVAVLPVAAAAAAAGWGLAALGVPALAAAFVALGLLALGTRAIHLDGLADTADGLGASWDVERALDVMRRGDVGPMGAATLVVVLGVQAAALASVLAGPSGWLPAAVAIAASRGALVLGTRAGVPAARPEGLGEAVAGSVPTWAAVASWTILTAALAGAGVGSGRPWWLGLVAAVAAVAAASAVLAWCRRRLGGITGDVLGALVEVAAAALLLVLAAG